MVSSAVTESIQIKEPGFGVEPEIIGKLACKGCKRYEMGVS
jgi:hypothetical protein